jgi:catechol 2,3-dioxygenase-like lactoylglutathione lyase family enzyme
MVRFFLRAIAGATFISGREAMLGDGIAVATVGVKDMHAARDFYGNKLGLTVVQNRSEETLSYKTGNGELFIYRTDLSGTNRATAVTWPMRTKVDDAVRELKAKGVTFEHYDLPEMHLEGDVHVHGAMRVAWFKDPDGNIHALVSS